MPGLQRTPLRNFLARDERLAGQSRPWRRRSRPRVWRRLGRHRAQARGEGDGGCKGELPARVAGIEGKVQRRGGVLVGATGPALAAVGSAEWVVTVGMGAS